MKKNYTLFNISSLLLILLAIFLLIGTFRPNNSTVSFEDPGLEQAVRDAIEKQEGTIELSDVELLQELDATDYDIKSLEGIQALDELRELNLEDNEVQSVSPLESLIKLEELNLRNNGITDLEEINFDDIIFLDLRDLRLRHNVTRDEEGKDTRLSDITLLAHMTSLRNLDLRDNHIEELSPLSNLRDLEELDIRENKFDTIEALEPLYQLEKLNLRDNQVESLEPLRYLTQLTYLNIHSVKGIDSLEPLSNLVNLETLIMRNVPIKDEGKFLENLTNLQQLNVIDTGFESIDSNIIENLRKRGALQGEVRPVRLLHTVEAPEISHVSGFYNQGFKLEIEYEHDNNIVYYTLDGSEPTSQSEIYKEPITITRNDNHPLTVLRVKVLSDDNTVSETVTKSYFVHEEADERFDLPVFSLVTDPENLFDEKYGIYTEQNREKRGSDWERPVHLDFFEADGRLALDQELGIRIHGGATRGYNQKSLRLYASSEYDSDDYMIYDFFDGLEKMNGEGPLIEFKHLLLRNSGNDWSQTMFSDALAQSLVEPLGTVDTQAYRPAVIFLNGEYYGIQNIRERQDEYYLENHYDVDKHETVILENNGSLYRGSNSDSYHYHNMIQYIEDNGLEDDNHFEYIQTLMDTENFRDYFASEIYFANADWPHNNIKFWRKTTDSLIEDAPYGHDGRWRWMLQDIDHGFYRSDQPFGDKGYPLNHTHNTIDWVMDEFDGRRGTQTWPNFLFRSLMSNTHFKNEFLNRTNDLLNSYLATEVVSDKINSMALGIENEIPSQIDRWGAIESMDEWSMYIDRKYLFANERPSILRGYIMEEFDIEDTVLVTVENESDMGYIQLNSINITSDLPGNSMNNTWSGTYFSGVPITIEAVPKDGYEFSHWEGFDSQDEKVEFTPDTDLNIKAVFTN